MSELTFALGPTNTGKTHRAVERMLEHDSGMIGLPLRLLAREVYDRVSRRVGERAVALVTGEEKRVPPAPRYWVATVEAMPMDVTVDLLAVDEIQLAAHRERGHVFTDRLLHARGRRETWFLGSDTMVPLATALFPRADVMRPSRLSTLRHFGKKGLGGLPPRSAVVAFSADEVYELASRLRVRRGGAAVVLGGLSPRTRNAQVALYQEGEVQHLVATDAIGMGLNLDLDHVAFASLRKFDGRDRRRLTDAELGQVAGRAGRYRRDGTFGTLSPHPPLDPETVRAIESHDFAPVRRMVWRNADLDFGSVDALLASLAAPAPDPRFVRVEQSDDFDALRALEARPEIRERATDEDRVRRLWEVCQIPDYRKLLLLRHVAQLGEVFVQLVDRTRLDPDWVEANVRRIDRIDGEVDTLTARLAAIRFWTYVSHRPGWIDDADGWQARTRAIEDRLSDALHARLVERFVERGRRTKRRAAAPRVEASGPFAQLGALLEAEHDEAEALAEAAVDAPAEALEVTPRGAILLDGRAVGRLRGGRELTSPQVRVEGIEGAGARGRVERRLVALTKDLLHELAGEAPARGDAAARGLAYQLAQGLGAAALRDVAPQLRELDEEARRRLGLTVGRRFVYRAASLTPRGLRLRAAFVYVFFGAEHEVLAESLPRAALEGAAALAAGYARVGPRLVRVDVLERALGELRALPVPFAPPPALASSLGADGVDGGRARAIWGALGYVPDDEGRLVPKRRRRARRR